MSPFFWLQTFLLFCSVFSDNKARWWCWAEKMQPHTLGRKAQYKVSVSVFDGPRIGLSVLFLFRCSDHAGVTEVTRGEIRNAQIQESEIPS